MHHCFGNNCAYTDMNKQSCEQDSSLQSVCPLNGHCRDQPATIQDANEAIKDTLKLSKLRSAALTSCSISQFSPTAAVQILL